MRESYHKAFEQIIGDSISGISITEDNALSNLQKAFSYIGGVTF